MRRRRCIQAKGHARGLGSKRQILARQKRALAHPQRDDLTHLSGATGLFAKLPLDLLGVELEDLANIIAPLKKPEREDAKASARDMRWCVHTHKK
jgi:hypothetical protein